MENIIIVILTIVVLLAAVYLVLVVLGWGLKIKSGSREQQGLTDLWIASQASETKKNISTDESEENHLSDQ